MLLLEKRSMGKRSKINNKDSVRYRHIDAFYPEVREHILPQLGKQT